MELLPLLLLLLFTTVSGKSHVHWRGLLSTVNCATSLSALAYMSYGCYCGIGGSGWPRDRAEWCCQNFGCCYSKVEEAVCFPTMERYNWECRDQRLGFGANLNKCQEIMYKCDKEIAHCLATAEYNAKTFSSSTSVVEINSGSVTDIPRKFSF
ncbi:group 10 secretory phospholipase A2-like [Trichosurus vulpecula]|uniref:group 10 secretory phospholipase A2-like n=1 Tax=Trichosurus vulpecula TaxID=9337 RepID=UPI00186ADA43|nr:group 10 secretory phospholipase A2-like [Trichosurus vulpecula]